PAAGVVLRRCVDACVACRRKILEARADQGHAASGDQPRTRVDRSVRTRRRSRVIVDDRMVADVCDRLERGRQVRFGLGAHDQVRDDAGRPMHKVRIARTHATSSPARGCPHGEEAMDTSDRTVIDRFNAAAQRRFSEFVATEVGLRHEERKPFCCTVCAPQLVYKLGLMLYALDLREGQRVLDFGTGAGWLARLLNQMGVEATGIDVAESAVEFARAAADASPQRMDRVALQFATYDGYRFPFDDGSFDRVACFTAFNHTPNRQTIFAEFARVLTDGGRATFVEPGGHHHESDQAKSE